MLFKILSNSFPSLKPTFHSSRSLIPNPLFTNMLFLHELLFTLGFSLLASFILAKLLSMASDIDDVEKEKSLTISEKTVKVITFSDESAKVNVRRDKQVIRAIKFDTEEVTNEVEAINDLAVDDPSFKVRREVNVIDEEGNLWNLGEEVLNKNEEERWSDDDWCGIDRTELEKRFGAAVAFVVSKRSNAADCVSGIDGDLKMELYGLHKVAMEGPCKERQPMALMVSARAKWNAWKQREDMSPEEAMEQYITLLSRTFPDWMGGGTSEKQ